MKASLTFLWCLSRLTCHCQHLYLSDCCATAILLWHPLLCSTGATHHFCAVVNVSHPLFPFGASSQLLVRPDGNIVCARGLFSLPTESSTSATTPSSSSSNNSSSSIARLQALQATVTQVLASSPALAAAVAGKDSSVLYWPTSGSGRKMES